MRGCEDRNERDEGREGTDVRQSDIDEERAVLKLLCVNIEMLEHNFEESEVKALVLGLDQPGNGEETRHLTTFLAWLSLRDMQHGQ